MDNNVYKISTGDYAKLLLTTFFIEQWFWFVLPLVVFGALAVIDIRFVIVAMMILFLIVPMVASMLYLNIMLSPETRWSTVEKSVEASAEGLQLRFQDEKTQSVVISRDMIEAVYQKDVWWVFVLKIRRYQYFVLPKEALASSDIALLVA